MNNEIVPGIIRLIIGLSLIRQSQYSEAIKIFTKITMLPEDFNYYNHFLLGYCYYQIYLFDKAESEFNTAIEIKPDFVLGYYSLAVLYYNEKKRIIAKQFLQACLKIDRNYSLAKITLDEIDKGMSWYNWWFNDADKENSKKLLGLILLGTAFVIIYNVLFLNIDNINLPIILGILFFILIMPNIKNLSIGDYKVELNPFLDEIKLEIFLAPNSLDEEIKDLHI
ncbi:MAG: tetratricopeptide repeat protein [Candidatus Nitrosocosmicus sp.]|jgi:tetratricopeptide (TPR) repeat protein